MKSLLEPGQALVALGMQSRCVVEELLGEGGQAEVYLARTGPKDFALKWYRPEYLRVDRPLWKRLKNAVSRGSPSEKFLWPFDLVSFGTSSEPGGYLMPLKPPDFVCLVDLIMRRCEPSFRSLTTLGFHLAQSFLRLHSGGLCYRDINFGNIFFQPDTGDVRIGDTDNVDIDRKPGGIMGTWGFMAPEVALGQAGPSSMSDRFSLAVLLFYIFMLGHPLKGKAEQRLHYDPEDPDGSRRLCAVDPVFVFDPANESNRPLPGVHDVVLNFWPIYPRSLRNLFTEGFTRGLHDPEGRVMDNDWRKQMVQLRDSIFLCRGCRAELFFDLQQLRKAGSLAPCWSCGAVPDLPPRMRLGNSVGASLVMLDPLTRLFPHHLEGDSYNFLKALAEVTSKPLALKNLSGRKWIVRSPSHGLTEILPGAILELSGPCTVHFGKTQGEIRV